MSKYVFVNDFFIEEYIGGAELTSEALIKECPTSLRRVKSSHVTKELMDELKDCIWIFGNFSNMPLVLIVDFMKRKIKYHIIEYDFKFCILRSPEKHKTMNETCTCDKHFNGKVISLFFSNSKCMWFMSEPQREKYLSTFKFLKNTESHILSSVFEKTLLTSLLNLEVVKDDTWTILNSTSWIKGTKKAIEFANQNKLKFKLVGGISHKDMLTHLSKSKGLIFLPNGGDTCPRIVIEAFLLKCELKLNDNVMHKGEPWFTGTREKCVQYLTNRASFFWQVVGNSA